MKSTDLLVKFLDDARKDNIINSVMYDTLRYRVQFYSTLDDIKNNKASKRRVYKCFCGAEFNGVECTNCGFDASEADIY